MRLFHASIFRQGKAKIVEKAQFTGVNEHFETIFYAGMAQVFSSRQNLSTYIHVGKKTTRAKVSI